MTIGLVIGAAATPLRPGAITRCRSATIEPRELHPFSGARATGTRPHPAHLSHHPLRRGPCQASRARRFTQTRAACVRPCVHHAQDSPMLSRSCAASDSAAVAAPWMNSGYIGSFSSRFAMPMYSIFTHHAGEQVGDRIGVRYAIAPGSPPARNATTLCRNWSAPRSRRKAESSAPFSAGEFPSPVDRP